MPTALLIGAPPAYARGLAHDLIDVNWSVEQVQAEGLSEAGPADVLLVLVPSADAATPFIDEIEPIVDHTVVLLPEPIAEDQVKLLRSGCTLVLDSTSETAHIATALDTMMDGHAIIPLTNLHRLAAIARSYDGGLDLADQERRWLAQLSAGLTVRAMAKLCHRSERATHRALAELYRRIGVSNRTAAVVWAHENGIETIDDEAC